MTTDKEVVRLLEDISSQLGGIYNKLEEIREAVVRSRP